MVERQTVVGNDICWSVVRVRQGRRQRNFYDATAALCLQSEDLSDDETLGETFPELQSNPVPRVEWQLSTVDYVLVSESVLPCVKSLHIDGAGQQTSDHLPLVLTLAQPSLPRGGVVAKTGRYNWRRPRDEQQQEQFVAGMEEAA